MHLDLGRLGRAEGVHRVGASLFTECTPYSTTSSGPFMECGRGLIRATFAGEIR